MAKVLLAGESWSTTTVHTKGFDSFTTSGYDEGGGAFIAALEAARHEVAYLPNHHAASRFPRTADELAEYDVVVLSDIGANTLLLPPEVFERGKRAPNRLDVLADWVRSGGGILMVGGYLTFQGIEAKANYRSTAIADVLPVEMETGDDREEAPQGLVPRVVVDAHPALAQVEGEWPALLGYQRLTPRDESRVLVDIGDHPLLVVGEAGAGRSAAFASDMGPHWMPAEAVEWAGYAPLWARLVEWLAGEST
ncbi:glutamine amidotransferase [Microbacterium halotolerans]|uniref:glutamine amidotransferase n=1 Tax=Microbacterium halotolerans TaxID=246613 RepID=UPI000E6AD247|nr:glutamine amidotransferase [Microbacterium halotolerans]